MSDIKKADKLPVISAAVMLAVICGILGSYQLSVNEVAVVTTFGKPKVEDRPGLHARLPWPLQKVVKLDRRQQLYEGVSRQIVTSDNVSLIVRSFGTWEIADPQRFYNSVGSKRQAEGHLKSLMDSSLGTVLTQHALTDFVSTEAGGNQLEEVEAKLQEVVAAEAEKTYGIAVSYVGIAQISLSESSTGSVLNRMRTEREQAATKIRSEAQTKAKLLRNEAESASASILAEAEAEAKRLRGEALITATKQFEEFKEDLDFAIFLRKLDALEQTTKTKTTLVLDPNTPPFDLLRYEGNDRSGGKQPK
jgi:membrane protease subunit HflC